MIRSADELPLSLNIDQVAEVLGISRAGAYLLAKQNGFPRLLVGRRVIVPKKALLEWMDRHTVGGGA